MVTVKVAPTFCCELCDYTTRRKSNYDKHLETTKHILAESGENKLSKPTNYECEKCKKIYNSRNGLWKHKKICTNSKNKHLNEINNELLLKILQQNKELQETVLQQKSALSSLEEIIYIKK
jgi:hypothetical protein